MPTRFSRVALIFVSVFTVAGGLALIRLTPVTAVDQEQPRLNQAAPMPHGDLTIGQTFTAAHNGLSAIELLAVVYPASPQALTLRLLDANNQAIASSSFTSLTHNAPLRLNFPPLPSSAGKTYTLLLQGSPNNQLTVWAYSLMAIHEALCL